jgi:glycosyltransferase involved in cell wall biosynthesis
VQHEAGPPEAELRVALFTGNYNYIKDGVALTLNRLVAFLEARGIPVLIFAPVAGEPAFPSVGEVVPVPSMAIPTRPEYRIALGLSKAARQRLEDFRPTLFHIAVPDIAGYKALKLAESWKVPVVASFHTRYDTYLRFYGLALFEKLGQRYMRHFYSRVRRIYPPSESMAEILRKDGAPGKVEIWARGVDSTLFSPEKRDMDWRRSIGIADDEVAISFAGRLVKEKNIAIYMRVLNALADKGLRVKPLVIGDGPEMAGMKAGLRNGVFAGFLHGEELARAYASSDIFFFPSESETFGNVTLEAMASGLPAVNAIASGSNSLVAEGVTGHLVSARDEAGLAARLAALAGDAALRKEMGDAARARALDYSWDTILSGLLDSYRAVLREARAEQHGR